MSGVKINTEDGITIVREVTTIIAAHMYDPSLVKLDVNKSDGGVIHRYHANGIFNI